MLHPSTQMMATFTGTSMSLQGVLHAGKSRLGGSTSGHRGDDARRQLPLHHWTLSEPASGVVKMDLACPWDTDCGGCTDENTFTAPDGTVVVASANTYNNNGPS